jgi:hypothetical protein
MMYHKESGDKLMPSQPLVVWLDVRLRASFLLIPTPNPTTPMLLIVDVL